MRKQQRAKVLGDVIEFGMRSAAYPHSYREQNFNSENLRLKPAEEMRYNTTRLAP